MGKELDKAARLMQIAIQTNTPVFVFDVETEGLDPVKHHIIQLSALKIDPETFEVLDKINVFINPCRPLSDKIKEITGYTDEFLATCPLEVEAFPEIYNFLGEAPLLIGHNVGFDKSMLDALYTRQGQFLFCEDIDTCRMARELLKKQKDVPSHKLIDVAAYYGADIGLDFHKADDDIIATLRIFQAMYDPDAYLKPKKKLNINSIWYHNGFRGHARIYIWIRIMAAKIFHWTISTWKIWKKKLSGNGLRPILMTFFKKSGHGIGRKCRKLLDSKKNLLMKKRQWRLLLRKINVIIIRLFS